MVHRELPGEVTTEADTLAERHDLATATISTNHGVIVELSDRQHIDAPPLLMIGHSFGAEQKGHDLGRKQHPTCLRSCPKVTPEYMCN